MEKIIKLLSESTLFQGLPPELLEKVASISIEQTFGRKEMIFSEGEQARGFYVVVTGSVKVFKVSPEGKEQIFHILGPGQPFAEVAVFTGSSYPANAEALKKSEMLFFPRQEFIHMIQQNPSLSMGMLAVLSMRLRTFTVQIENLSLKEVPARIATHILYLTREQGNRESVSLEISKGQLASLLGTIPETLSRILAKMSGNGLIRVQGKNIEITDMEGLVELADTGK